jgi:hypothetical protein
MMTVDAADELIEVDFFRPEDASGVARLFRQVYGEGYPIDIYYRPERLIEENGAGRILSSVARRAGTGEVIGHDALVLIDAASGLYENAAGAMLPGFRGQGAFFRLFQHNIFEYARRLGLREILGEPVCSHTTLQKMCLQLGFQETGLEVALMPAAAYSGEKGADARRVSVVMGYFLHWPAARTLYLPPVYRDALEYLYGELGLERTFAKPAARLSQEIESACKINIFPFAQVARIAIERIGANFDAFLSRLETEALGKGVVVFQTTLPLVSPFAALAVDLLRSRGYFIGGILPGWPGGDVLMMQRIDCEIDWDGIKLHSDRVHRIAEVIRSDCDSVK